MRHGRPGTPGSREMRATLRWERGGGSLRRLQKPCQTALSILPRLNVPRGTVADPPSRPSSEPTSSSSAASSPRSPRTARSPWSLLVLAPPPLCCPPCWSRGHSSVYLPPAPPAARACPSPLLPSGPPSPGRCSPGSRWASLKALLDYLGRSGGRVGLFWAAVGAIPGCLGTLWGPLDVTSWREDTGYKIQEVRERSALDRLSRGRAEARPCCRSTWREEGQEWRWRGRRKERMHMGGHCSQRVGA